MDIKIGFADSPRELVITSADSPEDVRRKAEAALSGEQHVVEFNDEKGRTYLVRTDRLMYIEIGQVAPRTVGFAGA